MAVFSQSGSKVLLEGTLWQSPAFTFKIVINCPTTFVYQKQKRFYK